jgi:hypothetical protein
MRYDATRVPRGPTRKWEIVIDHEDGGVAVGSAPRSAAEVKSEHRLLRDIPDRLLDGVALVAESARFERGERYLDLHDPARGEFAGDGHARVRPGRRVIARRSASPEMWLRLLDAADDILGRPRSRIGRLAPDEVP